MSSLKLLVNVIVLLVVLLSCNANLYSLDSLSYLGRFDKMDVVGLLSEFNSGEDWVYDVHYDSLPLPNGSRTVVVRRFQSMNDSLSLRIDTINGAMHRVGFSSPFVHGDFNGDGRRDYVGRGYWILIGTDTTYLGDSTNGNYIQPEIVADFDGDGYDDVGTRTPDMQIPFQRPWRIWWGDSSNPLETSSLVFCPDIPNDTNGFVVTWGERRINFMDRYNGVTVAEASSIWHNSVGAPDVYSITGIRVNEAELQAHQDTITCDSVLTNEWFPTILSTSTIVRRIGDTTLLQFFNLRLLVHNAGLTVIIDSGVVSQSGDEAGFGRDWSQRFLDYEYRVRDSVVTLLQYDADSLNYIQTHEFVMNNVDKGSRKDYLSMFPDVTGDGHLELAVTFEKHSGSYYTNIYDVWGSIPSTLVYTSGDLPDWSDPLVHDSHLKWQNASDGDCVIEVCNLAGKVLYKASTTGEQARAYGIALPSSIRSSDLLLIRVHQHGEQKSFKVFGGG